MWNIPLKEPIKLDSGEELRTLEDVRLLFVSIPADLRRHKKWRSLGTILVNVATVGDPRNVDLVADQLAHALETPPYAFVRIMPRGVGRPRKSREKTSPAVREDHRGGM